MKNNRIFRMLKANPMNLFLVIWWNIKTIFLKLCGYKTIVYNIQYDYFFNIFEPIYTSLSREKKIIIYFSWTQQKPALREFLLQITSPNHLLSNLISPYIFFDLFITAEINGPDFPVSFLPTKTIEIYHGTGVYALYEKKEVLARFDIHFAVGPQFVPFILSLPYNNIKGDNLRKVGFPKLDAIMHPQKEFHKYLKKLYKVYDRFVVLYTPHWNPDGSIHNLGLQMLERIAQIDDSILILVKVHNYLFTKFKDDNWHQKLDDLEKANPNIKIIHRPNTQEIYTLGNLLITDTGTTAALEYSLTEKPLFIYYSKEWFKHHKETEVEQSLIDVAITFTSTKEITTMINKMINKDKDMLNNLAKQKKKQQKLIKKSLYNPGNATQTACQVIKRELEI